mmetsp:Transcript_58261/g.103963  ORF Transcript_58261/g.103963 Transcript_58261/m.103963 type:complete len:297 (-) Transcript_58261:1615-2505(-)
MANVDGAVWEKPFGRHMQDKAQRLAVHTLPVSRKAVDGLHVRLIVGHSGAQADHFLIHVRGDDTVPVIVRRQIGGPYQVHDGPRRWGQGVNPHRGLGLGAAGFGQVHPAARMRVILNGSGPAARHKVKNTAAEKLPEDRPVGDVLLRHSIHKQQQPAQRKDCLKIRAVRPHRAQKGRHRGLEDREFKVHRRVEDAVQRVEVRDEIQFVRLPAPGPRGHCFLDRMAPQKDVLVDVPEQPNLLARDPVYVVRFDVADGRDVHAVPAGGGHVPQELGVQHVQPLDDQDVPLGMRQLHRP